MGRKKHSSRSRRAETAAKAQPAAAAPARRPDRLWRGGLAAVFLSALAIRLAAVFDLSRLALYRTPQLDSFEYLVWAQSIARGEFRWPLLPTHAPGYPYVLGGLLALFGSATAARVVQSLWGAALCVVVALLARRLFVDARAGLAAGFLTAVYGPLVYVETSLLAEGLFVFLLVLALWAFTSPLRSARPVLVAAAVGALLGLAALMRATALALVPALALLMLWDRRWPRPRREITLAAAALVVAALAGVTPAMVKVSRVAGSFIPLQAFGGLNLYMGNSPAGTGTPSARMGGEWDRLVAEPLRRGLSAAGQERYFTDKALAEIRQRPLAWLAVLGRKALWLVQDDEIRESHSYHFFRGQSRLLGFLPGFGLLFPLAVCGIWLAVSERSLSPALLVYLVVMAASCVLIVVASRYRIPLVPVLAVFAGRGATGLWDAFRRKRRVQAVRLAAVVVAAWIVGHLWNHDSSHDFTEEWVMTGQSLENEERLDEAEQAYRRALERDPDSALAWNGLGKIRMKRSDWAGAEEAFTAATRLDPDYERSYYYLGIAYRSRGETGRAVEAFRKAVSLAPDHVAAMAELGTLLVARGELEEADRLLRKVVAMDPGNAAANLGLARIAGAARRPQQGMPFAERAAQAEAQNPEAWMVLAMLAIEAKDAATAERALARVESLTGPDAPPVVLQRALLRRLQDRREEAERELKALLARHPRFEPAARLLVLNAAEQGRRTEAEDFLRRLWSGSPTPPLRQPP